MTMLVDTSCETRVNESGFRLPVSLRVQLV